MLGNIHYNHPEFSRNLCEKGKEAVKVLESHISDPRILSGLGEMVFIASETGYSVAASYYNNTNRVTFYVPPSTIFRICKQASCRS